LQEVKEGLAIERMYETMANCFSKSSKIMKHDLSLGVEFVLVHSAEMMAVEYRKIRRGVESCEHEPSLWMKDPTKFSHHGER
jgi:hypothetical protein